LNEKAKAKFVMSYEVKTAKAEWKPVDAVTCSRKTAQ